MKTQVLALSIAILAADVEFNFQPLSMDAKPATVSSIQSTDFAMFRIHRQGKNGVTAVWSVSSTDEITGFSVERTYQDPTDPYSMWEEAGTVPFESSRTFKYTDQVLAGQIAYRIVAHLADGTTVTSATETIRLLSH